MCKFAIISYIISCCLLFCTAADECDKPLKHLSETQRDYVRCATMHAVPIKLCIECELSYTNMVVGYEELVKIKNCSAKYIDKDRINIVTTTHTILQSLWSKANCDACFNGNNSQMFDQLHGKLIYCLNMNKGKECEMCDIQYKNLNTFYIKLDQNNNGNVCYDLQDAINRTRQHWSGDFKCCHRELNMTLFLLVSGIMGVIIILFYSSSFGVTWYNERNTHIRLLEDPEINTEPSSSVAQSQSTIIDSQNNATSLPSTDADMATGTSTSAASNNKKHIHLVDVSDLESDDDDIEYNKQLPAHKIL